MIKFFQNKHFKRFGVSVVLPLYLFWDYWRAFDGEYTGTDMFWGASVTIALAIAIYLYLPIFKKIERGSIIWFLVQFTFICLFILGLVLMGIGTHWVFMVPVEEEAWGEYISFFALFMFIIHIVAKKPDRTHDETRQMTPREILLFRGPAAWNKAER